MPSNCSVILGEAAAVAVVLVAVGEVGVSSCIQRRAQHTGTQDIASSSLLILISGIDALVAPV
jgi:hypothetical protein